MNTLLAVFTVLSCSGGTCWYIYLIAKEKVSPSLASWLVFTVTLNLSFWTYFSTSDFTWVAGTMNFASTINTIMIFGLLLCKKAPFELQKSQKVSLIFSGIIVLIWMVLVWGFEKTGFIPNLLTQILMIIAYSLTIQKVWGSTEMRESRILWWSVTLASLAGLAIGINKGDILTVIYGSRSTICSGLLLYVMHRVNKKKPIGTFQKGYS